MVATHQFSRDFATARQRFLAAASRAGARLESHEHRLAGPDGEVLTTDVARIGDLSASQLLVLISGVHGVEHFVGSACMIDWLECRQGTTLPQDTAVLLIHGINPWGAAHGRRYTEDNIDLARNFLDFSAPLPPHAAYEAVHDAISSADRASIAVQLGELFEVRGESYTIEALMAGQFVHPTGFSYGGNAPCWSHRLLSDILARHAGAAKSVAIVEYHSGLGPYGHGMVVTMQTGPELERLRSIFGNELHSPRANAGLHSAPGHTTDGYIKALGDSRLCAIVLEFGTFPPDQSLPVLLEDHWLTHHGDPASADGRAIRAHNLEMHCPDDREWENQVIARSRQIIGLMLAALPVADRARNAANS